MSNLLLFPDRRKTMSEAALWLVRIGEGLTDDERRELEQWLAGNPRNAQVLMRLANVSSWTTRARRS